MTYEDLTPNLDVLSQEYVLVQAWKKASAYIRYHNWYADTLDLDRNAINLPEFLGTLAAGVRAFDGVTTTPLRMVLAPKSQPWRVSPKNGQWEPSNGDRTPSRLRPLAHVSLSDQVLTTALMMCLANRVESIQGSPVSNRKTVASTSSYGNRLFCSADGEVLKHRWGSSKLYRQYFEDYRNFLSRPDLIVQSHQDDKNSRIVVVSSDLKQFYDRVRPDLLHRKIFALQRPGDDPRFFQLVSRALSWNWNDRDRFEVQEYARASGIDGFDSIALPQGLVAAGFFANVVLLDFDASIRARIGQLVAPGVQLLDYSRYVDDLRIVARVNREISIEDIPSRFVDWLQRALDQTASGLIVSEDKTRASAPRGSERPLIRQSRRMRRIQEAVSGGFDATGGVEILDAVQGLLSAQEKYSRQDVDPGWALAPIPDVKDATVSRFAATKFRRTYRSLRPMLQYESDPLVPEEVGGDSDLASARRARSQKDLDEEARTFALGLVESWVYDPANVRLLRIGLDLWPSADVLQRILDLLRPYVSKGGGKKAPRRVAWYCLSEILRAGATETGFVDDEESLPKNLSLKKYREILAEEAVRIALMSPGAIPWYLRQQALLFLAVWEPFRYSFSQSGRSPETKHYKQMIQFLRGEANKLPNAAFAESSILATHCFRSRLDAVEIAARHLNARRVQEIFKRDVELSYELLNGALDKSASISPRMRDDMCLEFGEMVSGEETLARVVMADRHTHPLRNELAWTRLAARLLRAFMAFEELPRAITPVDVRVSNSKAFSNSNGDVKVHIVNSRVDPDGSIYLAPEWCPDTDRWRFQLGYLLRFVLLDGIDHSPMNRSKRRNGSFRGYVPGISHRYQRQHGLYSGHEAFGADWLPISDWSERFISALMQWPGQREWSGFAFIEEGMEATVKVLEDRVAELESSLGEATGIQIIPLVASWPMSMDRPLRGCVLQLVLPQKKEFIGRPDLTFSDSLYRKKHRQHLSSALAAVERMLDLRETHRGLDERLDWLILPELAVHPDDVVSHLIPFARARKTIVLAGLTYESLFPGHPLVNSAIWVIPSWDSVHGLQIRIRRQGKKYLAPIEESLNSPVVKVSGFRPCQWLIGYQWTSDPQKPPLWLTSSVCYDATDLALATDLRNRSDVFAIPALNQDTTTFDHMSLALHYHMYQMVIVANKGEFGGSSAYAPYKEPWDRQVFHLHGQPQASIAFFEIDPVVSFQDRKKSSAGIDGPKWKPPPAGL